MIRHIVAWNYKEGFTDEENKINAQKVKYELENLKNLVKEIVSIEVIIDLAKDSNRDIVLTSLFETEQDLQAYEVNTDHAKAGSYACSVLQDIVLLNYYE